MLTLLEHVLSWGGLVRGVARFVHHNCSKKVLKELVLLIGCLIVLLSMVVLQMLYSLPLPPALNIVISF